MSRIPKSVVSFGGLFLAVGVLTLAVPRALHAVAEALVQVSNTTENPAITQSVPSQASRLVYLTASLPPNTSSGFFSGGMAYTLPAGQSLVITAVDHAIARMHHRSVPLHLNRQQFIWPQFSG